MFPVRKVCDRLSPVFDFTRLSFTCLFLSVPATGEMVKAKTIKDNQIQSETNKRCAKTTKNIKK